MTRAQAAVEPQLALTPSYSLTLGAESNLQEGIAAVLEYLGRRYRPERFHFTSQAICRETATGRETKLYFLTRVRLDKAERRRFLRWLHANQLTACKLEDDGARTHAQTPGAAL